MSAPHDTNIMLIFRADLLHPTTKRLRHLGIKVTVLPQLPDNPKLVGSNDAEVVVDGTQVHAGAALAFLDRHLVAAADLAISGPALTLRIDGVAEVDDLVRLEPLWQRLVGGHEGFLSRGIGLGRGPLGRWQSKPSRCGSLMSLALEETIP